MPEPSEWLASTGEVLDRLVDALRAAGYDVDVLRDPAAPPHLLRLSRGPERVDLLPPVIAFQQAALSRASEGVVTAEDDLIVFKLIAWRPRDRDDVRSILEAGVPLDDDYIDGWVREWDVADRWRQARRWRPDA